MRIALPAWPLARFALILVLAGCASQPSVRSPGGTAASASASASASAPAPAPARPYLESALVHGDVLLGGQPAAADYALLAAAGVSRVVTLRSDEEIATLGFDPSAVASAAGQAHRQIPIAGAAGYTPEALDAFAAEMQAAEGRMLLHCATGVRAGQLYAAWLVRHRGRTPDQAMREVAPLGLWPLPMERLLDQPLRLEPATDPVACGGRVRSEAESCDGFEKG